MEKFHFGQRVIVRDHPLRPELIGLTGRVASHPLANGAAFVLFDPPDGNAVLYPEECEEEKEADAKPDDSWAV